MPTQPAKRRQFRHGGGFGAALPFLLPVFVLYGTFILFPIANAIWLSFFEWDGFAASPRTWVGLDNYDKIFNRDPVFWVAFRNSAIWLFLSVLIPTTLGLILALAVNRKMIGRTVFRSIFYLPAVIAPIAVATIWKWIYNPNFGVVNKLLALIGLDVGNKAWLGEPSLALYAVFIASTWTVAGFNMVLFLAGLQGIPRQLTEAAKIDGANAWQVFRNVTWPGLRPTTVVVVVFSIINGLKAFDLIVGMTGGGPAQKTQLLALWSYSQSFGNHDFGAGNAVATVLLALTLAVVVPYLWWSMRSENS